MIRKILGEDTGRTWKDIGEYLKEMMDRYELFERDSYCVYFYDEKTGWVPEVYDHPEANYVSPREMLEIAVVKYNELGSVEFACTAPDDSYITIFADKESFEETNSQMLSEEKSVVLKKIKGDNIGRSYKDIREFLKSEMDEYGLFEENKYCAYYYDEECGWACCLFDDPTANYVSPREMLEIAVRKYNRLGSVAFESVTPNGEIVYICAKKEFFEEISAN